MMYRILIVEDDPSIAAGLSYALEKEGYFVTQCRSVAEAFEVSEAVHFDLAVLDMQLPDGVGKEIGQKLGEMRGERQGESRVNQLNQKLIALGRMDDMLKSVSDTVFQQKLFKEFNL